MFTQRSVAWASSRALRLATCRHLSSICPSSSSDALFSAVTVPSCAPTSFGRLYSVRRSWFSDRAAHSGNESKSSDVLHDNSDVTNEHRAEPDEDGTSQVETSVDEDGGIDRSKFTQEIKIRMPELGEAGEDFGSVEKWYKKEGDIIRRNDTLCDIHTELFTFGMVTEDECDAIMGEILVPVNSDPVEPGTVLCMVMHEEEEEEKSTDEE